MALAYPFRGKTWTITQRREGMDVTRNDGFSATLLREDGALRFSETDGSIVIDASARSGGPGRLAVQVPYLTRKFGIKTPKGLVVRVSNRRSRFRVVDNAVVLDLNELGRAGQRIEIGGP